MSLLTSKIHTHHLKGSVRLSVGRLVMDALIPLPGFCKSLEARVVVLTATRTIVGEDGNPHFLSQTHLCGTNYGVFIRGLDFPFRTFASRHYDDPTNPYDAANRYTHYLGSMVVPLLGCPDSLRYVYLADIHYPRPPHA